MIRLARKFWYMRKLLINSGGNDLIAVNNATEPD